ncbi:MAG TPA: cation-transporting P-type ATPase, partial [Gemmatimonadaceae bacterium]|nr:cation-transporting P-type ATPase [Gemmatimonadaceae bacterium]
MKINNTTNGAPIALTEFARLPANGVLEQLGVSRSGLSETAAQERTEQYGPNKVAHEAPPTWYFQLAHAFWNPFIGVLLALGILSYITGDIGAVVVISTLVTISALLV